jgi:hypothetical protein
MILWFEILFLSGCVLFIVAGVLPWLHTLPMASPLKPLILSYRVAGRLGQRMSLAQEAKESTFAEQALMAGVHWNVLTYQRWCAVGALCGGGAMLIMLLVFSTPGDASQWGKVLFLTGACGALGWISPAAYLHIRTSQRRTQLRYELSKFSHRLYICVTDKADLREMIIRASRPLHRLRPHIQKLVAQWSHDQRMALETFKEEIGISEVYPLVNALMALSRAHVADVGKLLREHSRSLDETLHAEWNGKVENAPIWISLYVMVPFFICLLLFIYPWMMTVMEQLRGGFI